LLRVSRPRVSAAQQEEEEEEGEIFNILGAR
jgi:hypothetical protein